VDGIKNHCSLLALEGLVFEADDGPEASGVITNEVDAYIRANSSGRAAYAVAAADLDCLESQVLAAALLNPEAYAGTVRWYAFVRWYGSHRDFGRAPEPSLQNGRVADETRLRLTDGPLGVYIWMSMHGCS
jgi:hypothetical protein